jgi:hypothetical protein
MLKLLLQGFEVDPHDIAHLILLLDPILVLLAALSQVFLEGLLISDPILLKFMLGSHDVLHDLVNFYFSECVSLNKVGLLLPIGSRYHSAQLNKAHYTLRVPEAL